MTWEELVSVFQAAFPGWTGPNTCKWALIPYVWKFRAFYGMGSFDETEKIVVQSCLASEMTGLFGSGKENGRVLTKPHRFELELGSTGVPMVTSYYSASETSAVFRAAVPILRSVPVLSSLRCYDLETHFLTDRQKLVQSWEKLGDRLEEACVTVEQLQSYRELKSGFADFKGVVNPFGESSDAFRALAAKLGAPSIKGTRKKRRAEHDGEHSDAENWSGGEEDDADVLPSEEEEEEQEEWAVERILRSEWNMERQQYDYLVVFEGTNGAEEWIPESDMNGGPIYDAFVAQRDKSRASSRSAIAVSSFREVNKQVLLQDQGIQVECEWCHKTFKQRGLSKHKKSCRHRPDQ